MPQRLRLNELGPIGRYTPRLPVQEAGRCETVCVNDSVTVFLLDDHEIVRRGLRELFEAEEDMVVVGEASTQEEAVNRVGAVRPNVGCRDAI